MTTTSDDETWLPAATQQVWRRWMRLQVLLPAELHRQLQEDAGLSLSDFAVLVHLTDSPEGRVRVTDLAHGLQWERSRVSHHVTRMERRGLVGRQECRQDGRGAWVVVTGEGRTAIQQAAPGHVAAVRRLVFDPLTEDELEVFGRVVEKLLGRLEPDACPSGDPAAVPA